MRFARAKGSKASNERVPEEATPWQEIKQQLAEAKKKQITPQEEDAADVETQNDVNPLSSWAEFEETSHKKRKHEKALASCSLEPSKRKKKKGLKKAKDLQEEEVFEETPLNTKGREETKSRRLVEASDFQTVKKIKKGDGFEKMPGAEKMTRQQKIEAGLPSTRRKPIFGGYTMNLGGTEVEIRKFHGFSVMKDDWERLMDLQKRLRDENIPEDQIQKTMKLERRRAEKALAHKRKKVCFRCRQGGHMLSQCPLLLGGPPGPPGRSPAAVPDAANAGICFKCGSTEHSHFDCKVVKGDDYKFASCFVCGDQGHISRQCPDNPNGLYPRGGGCAVCGDVTHFRKDCPKSQKEKEERIMTLPTMSNDTVEDLDTNCNVPEKKGSKTSKKKVVNF